MTVVRYHNFSTGCNLLPLNPPRPEIPLQSLAGKNLIHVRSVTICF